MIATPLKFKKYHFFLIGIPLIVLGCFLIPVYLPGFRGDFKPSIPSYHNKPIGTITKEKLFVQEHVAKMNYLNGVEILLATWARNNSNYNHLAILDTGFNVLAQQRFPSSKVKDNSYYAFGFPVDVYVGKGNKVFICLFSEDGAENNSITAWSDTTIYKGKLYQVELKNQNISESAKGEKLLLKGSLVFNTVESDRNNYINRVIFLLILSIVLVPLLVLVKQVGKKYPNNLKTEIVLTILFALWIILPALYFYTLKDRNMVFSRREMRNLASKPELNLQEISTFSNKYENYFNDHFPGRDEMIIQNSLFHYKLFKRSLFPTKVLIGKEGWTFRPTEIQTLEGKWDLSTEKIHDLVKVLHDRTLYYKSKGIAFYVAPVPLKSDIYREYLPDYCNISDHDNILDNITKALLEDELLKIIDLKSTLLQAKSEGRVFFKTDFHWSEFGAYKAYYEIIKRIQEDFPKVKPLEPNDFEMLTVGNPSGNDAVEIGLEGHITESCYQYHIFNPKSKEMPEKGYRAPEGFVAESEFYEMVRSTPDTSLPKILVIRDSFYHFLVPLTGESFRSSVFIWDAWQYGLNSEIIEIEKPDIVLLVPYMGRLPNILDSIK